MLELIQPWELALRVPAQRPFVAVPVVDVDFDVAGVGAAGRDEETAHGATDLGRRGGEGAVFASAGWFCMCFFSRRGCDFCFFFWKG